MKLQSAIEYLMTYFWAILIVAIIVVVLVKLSVFSSNTYAPKAEPGACSVVRNIYGGSSFSGSCASLIPQFVAQFNGASGYINAGSGTSLQSGVLTITAWIDPAAIPAPQSGPAAITGSLYNSGPEFRLESTGVLGFLKESVTSIGTSTSKVSVNLWYFVAVTYDRLGDYTFYINGANAGSGTNLQSFSWSAQLIGENGAASGEQFDGLISNLQIYNTTLSANSIQTLYQKGIGGTPISLKNLVGWWPLNGDTNDYSGNGNNGVATSIVFVNNWYSNYVQP